MDESARPVDRAAELIDEWGSIMKWLSNHMHEMEPHLDADMYFMISHGATAFKGQMSLAMQAAIRNIHDTP